MLKQAAQLIRDKSQGTEIAILVILHNLQILKKVLLSGVLSWMSTGALLACRFTWLPLWVLGGDGEGLDRDKPSSSKTAESAAVTVLVQWQGLWRLSDLEQPPWGAAALSNATTQRAA